MHIRRAQIFDTLARSVKYFKENKEERDIMCETVGKDGAEREQRGQKPERLKSLPQPISMPLRTSCQS